MSEQAFQWVTPATIRTAVAEMWAVPERYLVSCHRTAEVVEARHVAIWLTRRLTLLSAPAIGRLFGGRDHTTVLHAVRRIDERLGSDPDFARRVAIVEGSLFVADGVLARLKTADRPVRDPVELALAALSDRGATALSIEDMRDLARAYLALVDADESPAPAEPETAPRTVSAVIPARLMRIVEAAEAFAAADRALDDATFSAGERAARIARDRAEQRLLELTRDRRSA